MSGEQNIERYLCDGCETWHELPAHAYTQAGFGPGHYVANYCEKCARKMVDDTLSEFGIT